ncbi:MAG: phasin family protein [Betaproteobacteria bacterium]|nr:phasin family protein [Betaproteobacteria bacterium]
MLRILVLAKCLSCRDSSDSAKKGKYMLNTSSDMVHAIKANTDAFMAFSEIAISSMEKLTALNLSATRSSLEESAASATSMLELKGAMPSSKAKNAVPLAVSESVTAYFQSVQEIATEAQQEITKLITTYLASPGNGLSNHAGWLKGFDAFKGIGQQFAAVTEANRKAMTDITSRVVNQANMTSKKSA